MFRLIDLKHPIKKKQIFITGTDTGVGKTYISRAIAESYLKIGYSVAYFKPIETGCDPICNDVFDLTQITGQPYEEAILYSFKIPSAPLPAERKEGKKIDVSKILKHYERLKEMYNIVIVEGAGGIMVPITIYNGKPYTYLNFIQDTDIPVMVVAKSGLGTINHTTLTVNTLKSAKADIRAVILNKYPKNPNWVERTNPEMIELLTEIRAIIKVPFSDFGLDDEVKQKLMFWI